jgi:hypothetical protein
LFLIFNISYKLFIYDNYEITRGIAMAILFTVLGFIISYVVLGIFTLDSGSSGDAILFAASLICGSMWGSAAWIVQTLKKLMFINNKV